jgi:hypothetical protein
MTKHFKKIKRIIPAKTAPILVIVFALVMLISGGYFVYAINVGLPVLLWNNGGAGTPAAPTDVIHGVAVGAPLTAGLFNGLVKKVDDMDKALSWKLAAKSVDNTEEAGIDITPSRLDIETDYQYQGQSVDGNVFYFPTKATELLFIVTDDHDHFCVGGNAALSLHGGAVTRPTAIRRFYQGDTRYYWTDPIYTCDNWMKLIINGNTQIHCYSDQFPGGDPVFDALSALHPARFVWNYNGLASAVCNYNKGSAWNGDITSLRVEEGDWSDAFSAWTWELWYR